MPVNFKGGLLVNGENVTTETEVETLQEELDTKAVLGAFNGGGTGVDYADLATNLRTEQGATVEDAIAQLSPISVAVEDGDFAEMTDVKGRSFAYNQLMKNGNFDGSITNWNAINSTATVSNNVATITISQNATSAAGIYQRIATPILNHKYLRIGVIKANFASNFRFGQDSDAYNSIPFSSGETKSLAYITKYTQGNGAITIYNLDPQNHIGETFEISNVKVFDLTAMGLDSVATVDEALAALRAYGVEPTVYNEYSAGKIIDSQPNKIISKGFNQWNEEWELGRISGSNGTIYAGTDAIRSKNFNPIIGNATYYGFFGTASNANGIGIYLYDKDKVFIQKVNGANTNFQTPANACYFKINTDSTLNYTTYNHDICINVSNPSLNGTYKPFVKDEHALTLPVMRSAGNVYDDKEMVRVGTVDLGTLNWSYDSTNELFYTTDLSTLCKKVRGNAFTSAIYINSGIKVLTNMSNLEGQFLENGALYLKNTSYTNVAAFKAAMSGVMLNYELATPAPQDPAINLPQNIKVYNGGTLETQYESPNTTPALVSMLYQVNLKNFVEGVGSKEDINWDPQNVASKTEVDKKANTEDIKSGALIARLADDLTPYSDASGAEQSNPFIINGTGTNNNTEIVTVGTYAFLKEKQGNTLVVNQLAKAINSTNWGSSDNTKGTVSFNGGEITYSIITPGVSYVNGIRSNLGTTGKPGHIYVLLGEFKSNKNGVIKLGIDILNIPINYQPFATLTTSYALYGVIINATNDSASSGSIHICTRSTDGVEEGDNFTSRNIILVDLTQMFGSNDKIPQDLLDNPSHFFWYYNGSLDRNTGTLENSNGVKLVSTGRNIWDEEWEVGTINYVTGDNNDAQTRIRSKNYIQVVPNKTFYQNYNTTGRQIQVFYYDKNHNFLGYENSFTQALQGLFTTPSNCYYIRFIVASDYGTTYKNDITITPYYTPAQGGEGYDQYYPHEEPHVIDTGTGVLRSAGNVRDSKAPDGIITRRIVSYTFTGNESNIDILPVNNSETARENGKFTIQNVTNILPGIKSFEAATYTKPNILFSEYETIPSSGLLNSTTIAGNMVASTYGTYLYFEADKFKGKTDTEVKQMLAGLTVYVEMATPTTEQGTPFPENIDIDDYGMMYWLDEDDELVETAQGAKIFYPVNYKGFTDDMYSRVDGDSSAFVTHDNIPINEIKDRYGRLRFVEFNGTVNTIQGVTITYCKASLSGTHFMFVVRGSVANGTVLNVGTNICYFPIASWIYNKIVPVWASNVLDAKTLSLRGDDWSNQTVTVYMYKSSGGTVAINIAGASAVTVNADRHFWLQFDLLIDLAE